MDLAVQAEAVDQRHADDDDHEREGELHRLEREGGEGAKGEEGQGKGADNGGHERGDGEADHDQRQEERAQMVPVPGPVGQSVDGIQPAHQRRDRGARRPEGEEERQEGAKAEAAALHRQKGFDLVGDQFPDIRGKVVAGEFQLLPDQRGIGEAAPDRDDGGGGGEECEEAVEGDARGDEVKLAFVGETPEILEDDGDVGQAHGGSLGGDRRRGNRG